MSHTIKTLMFIVLVAMGTVACKTAEKSSTSANETNTVPAQFLGKVVVQLLNGVEIAALESEFSKYKLKHASVANRNMNEHLFQFDQNTIDVESLLKKLNKSKSVYEARLLSVSSKAMPKLQEAPKKKLPAK